MDDSAAVWPLRMSSAPLRSASSGLPPLVSALLPVAVFGLAGNCTPQRDNAQLSRHSLWSPSFRTCRRARARRHTTRHTVAAPMTAGRRTKEARYSHASIAGSRRRCQFLTMPQEGQLEKQKKQKSVHAALKRTNSQQHLSLFPSFHIFIFLLCLSAFLPFISLLYSRTLTRLHHHAMYHLLC